MCKMKGSDIFCVEEASLIRQTTTNNFTNTFQSFRKKDKTADAEHDT